MVWNDDWTGPEVNFARIINWNYIVLIFECVFWFLCATSFLIFFQISKRKTIISYPRTVNHDFTNEIFSKIKSFWYVWSDILWLERVAPVTQKGRCNCWHYFDKGRTDCRTETDREVQWNKLTRLIQSILYWPVKSIVDKIEWTQSYSVDEWSVRTRADVLFIDWWWFTTLKELCSNSYSELCGTTLEHQVNSKFNKTQDLSV